MGSAVVENVGNYVAGTDALNKNSGDALYMPINYALNDISTANPTSSSIDL